MVNNESIIADNAAVKEILHSAVENVIKEKAQTPSIRNELFGVEIAKISRWYRGINLVQISLNGNKYWASINYLFHDDNTSICNLPMGAESTDDEGMTYITPSNDIYVNVIPYSNNTKLDYLITGFTDNENTITPTFHPERGEIIIQNGENKIGISPGHVFIKSDNIMLSNEPEILDGEEEEPVKLDRGEEAAELKKIRESFEEQNKILKKWSKYDVVEAKTPEDRSEPDEEEYKIHLPKKYDRPEYKELKKAITELNSLIGLAEVKKNMENIISVIEYNLQHEKQIPISKNLIFTGNPGTGKTTVAKIVSRIYKGLKLLKPDEGDNNDIVVKSRGELIGEYVGTTPGKVTKAFAEAKGKVLFIDEAYLLCTSATDDYGKEALGTMVNLMHDDGNDNFAVILAGYDTPIKNMLSYNEGLSSRFNTFLNFADYSPNQLMNIFKSNMKEYDMKIEEDANILLEIHLEQKFKERSKGFGNARYVVKLFRNSTRALAMRHYVDSIPDSVPPSLHLSDIENAIIHSR